MNTEEKCEIVRAIDEGIGIQRQKVPDGNWTDVTGKDSWLNFDMFDYRKKPEPREPRVHFCNDYGDYLSDCAWRTKDKAKEAASRTDLCAKQIKFVEEIEE